MQSLLGSLQLPVSGPLLVPQILDAMNQDSGIPLTQLQVDGGMTSNRLLMQLQADTLWVRERHLASHTHTTQKDLFCFCCKWRHEG